LIKLVPTVLPIIGGRSVSPPKTDSERRGLVDKIINNMNIHASEWWLLSQILPEHSNEIWLLIQTLRHIQRGFADADRQWEEEIHTLAEFSRNQEERGVETPPIRIPSQPERRLYQEDLDCLRAYLPLVMEAVDFEAIDDGDVDEVPDAATPSVGEDRPTIGPIPTGSKTPTSDDPLSRTITTLGKAKKMIDLIRFLAGREARKAELATIITKFYGRSTANKRNLRTPRRLAERTRRALEEKGCPLRLDISDNVVRLIDADPVA
jgi:hypothetical protein